MANMVSSGSGPALHLHSSILPSLDGGIFTFIYQQTNLTWLTVPDLWVAWALQNLISTHPLPPICAVSSTSSSSRAVGNLTDWCYDTVAAAPFMDFTTNQSFDGGRIPLTLGVGLFWALLLPFVALTVFLIWLIVQDCWLGGCRTGCYAMLSFVCCQWDVCCGGPKPPELVIEVGNHHRSAGVGGLLQQCFQRVNSALRSLWQKRPRHSAGAAAPTGGGSAEQEEEQERWNFANQEIFFVPSRESLAPSDTSSTAAAQFFEQKIMISPSNSELHDSINCTVWIKRLLILLCCVLTLTVLVVWIYMIVGAVMMHNAFMTNNTLALRNVTTLIVQEGVQFINESVIQGKKDMNDQLGVLQSQIQDALIAAIKQFSQDLLVRYKVKDTFQYLDDLADGLDEVSSAMTFIGGEYKNVFKSYDEFRGALKQTLNNLMKVQSSTCQVLQGTDSAMYSICISLSSTVNSILSSSIDQNNVNAASSAQLAFVMQVFNFNITQLVSSIQNGQNSLDTKLAEVYTDILKEFNLTNLFSSISTLWVSLDTLSADGVSGLTAIPDSVSSLGDVVDLLLSTVQGIVGGLVGLTFLFIFTCFLYYIRVICVDECASAGRRPAGYKEKGTQDSVYTLDTLATSSVKFEDWSDTASNRSLTLQEKYSSSNPFCCHRVPTCFLSTLVIVFSVFSLFVAVVAVVYFLLGNAVQTDVCRYIQPPTDNNHHNNNALKVADVLTNTFMAIHWSTWTEALSSSVSDVPLTIPVPQNILNGLLRQCDTAAGQMPTGLFTALSMKNLINVVGIVNGEQFQSVIKTGETVAREKIGTLDMQNLVPESTKAIFIQAKNITDYFDKIDYTSTLQELSKPVVYLPNYSNSFSLFVNDTLRVASRALQLNPSSQAAILFETHASNLNDLLPSYNTVSSAMNKLHTNFQTLQDRRTLTTTINNALASLEAMQVILNDNDKMTAEIGPAYQETLKTLLPQVTSLMQIALNALESALLPCQRLPTIMRLLNAFLCQDSSVTYQMWAYAFYAFLTALGLQISLIFCWALIRYIGYLQTNANVSEC